MKPQLFTIQLECIDTGETEILPAVNVRNIEIIEHRLILTNKQDERF